MAYLEKEKLHCNFCKGSTFKLTQALRQWYEGARNGFFQLYPNYGVLIFLLIHLLVLFTAINI